MYLIVFESSLSSVKYDAMAELTGKRLTSTVLRTKYEISMRKRRGRNLSVFKGIYIFLSLKQNSIQMLSDYSVSQSLVQQHRSLVRVQFTQGSWSNFTKYTILIQNTISDIHEVYIR